MNRSLKIYSAFLILLFVAIIVMDANAPKPINWNATYSLKDKIPYGLFILDQEIEPMLENRKISKVDVTPYEYFDPLYDYDSLVNTYTVSGTLFAIGPRPDFDVESVTEMLYFAEHGNTVFLSMAGFPQALLDSIQTETQNNFAYPKTTVLSLSDPAFTDKYEMEEGIVDTHFTAIDTLNTTILGYHKTDTLKPNFIRVAYKRGWIYLHTQPAVFTNLHLLKDNHHEYAAKVLSYIPEGDVFWYTKSISGNIVSNAKLRFIFSQPALKAAWYLFLFGMLVFILFNIKRKQRVVPIIKPLENTTIDFTKTIGNLYFQEGDHDNIIHKKIIYFLDRIRQEYLLETTILDEKFIKKLHLKSGKNLQDIQRVVYLINHHRKGHFESVESDLIELNNLMEKINN